MDPLFTWPGCKASRIKHMTFPKFEEYREPFCGSAAVFFHLLPKKAWLNDLDPNIINLFTILGNEGESRKLFASLKTPSKRIVEAGAHENERRRLLAFSFKMIPNIEYAHTFLLMCRRSFRGNPYKPGIRNYASTNPRGWISENCLGLAKMVRDAHRIMKTAKTTCLDFSKLIEAPGKSVFLFLDPPYYMEEDREKSNAFYYTSGGLELHARLHALLKKTKHKFMLTIEDCVMYRQLYRDWTNIKAVETTYAPRVRDKKVTELFITNY